MSYRHPKTSVPVIAENAPFRNDWQQVLSVNYNNSIEKSLWPVTERGGWFSIVRESYPGAWQHNIEINFDSVLSHHAVYACVTLIAADIAKLRVKLVEQQDGVWTETDNPAYTPVLRKPNAYQTRNQFWESYVLSKLLRGNTYVLKQRDGRGVVVALYVLDPCRVKPLVSDDGSVFYQLSNDNVSRVDEDQVTVPASEIIHDRFNCLFHPLCGVSPIYASGLSATHGLSMQKNATRFFDNAALPGGLLLAPGNIPEVDIERARAAFENKYSGPNVGRVAILGSGMKFERMTMTSVESQMIEQLKWTAEVICATFHVPKYKIGVGEFPPYTDVQSANTEYYQQCLQSLIEAAETCLDEGLGMSPKIGTEFDIDGLLRMDSVRQMEVLEKGKGILKINEKRRRLDLPPVAGGDDIYLQQQDYSLAALRKRDAKPDPFATTPPPAPEPDDEPADDEIDDVAAGFAASVLKTQLDLHVAA